MRAIEPWVEAPLTQFLAESSARVALLMTGSGQVVAQHGFTRSLDLMAAAALGAGIVASTGELARIMGNAGFGSVIHQGRQVGIYLAPFDLPGTRWVGLVVFGPETTLGIVQLFFGQLIQDLARAVPAPAPTRARLPETFEDELNASLRAMFGR
jgi:hypothetical protein